jgi:hypothetical protein
MPWLLRRRKWVVRWVGPNEALLAPRGSIIIINTMSNNVGVVYRAPAGGEKEGGVEVVSEPPTVDGEPEPGMCVLGRYIPCGEDGIKQLQDWLARFPIIVIYNIGFPIHDPGSDGLPPDYYCHHGYTALVIPIKRGGKQRRVDRLPWKKACQVSVLTLHEVLSNSGFGVRLE